MNEQVKRDRKSALYDKNKSVFNYMKSDNNNITPSSKQNFSEKNFDCVSVPNSCKIKSYLSDLSDLSDLPKPPLFSNDTKTYYNKRTSEKLFFHQKATIINNFDNYELIDNELSLVNLENFLAKFEEDELMQLTIKDIFTFDLKDLDSIKTKLEEFSEVSLKLGDGEVIQFLKEKIKSLENNRNNIDMILSNMDKIEDFVIWKETLKVFFRKNKK